MKTTPNHGLSYVEGDDKPADYPSLSQENMTKLDTLIQQLIDGKAPLSHNHSIGQIMGLTEALDAKADQQATATALAGKASSSHTHTMDGITGLVAALAAKANQAAVDTALAQKANTSHTHTQADITGLTAALGKKADQSTLDTRVPSGLALRVDNSVGTRILAGNTMIYGDTGLRALALWDADGNVTHGTLPTGIEPVKASGGLYIRRRGHRVSYWIKGARIPSQSASLPLPSYFSPSGPIFPTIILRVSRTVDPISINVGSNTIYLVATAGTTIAGSGDYSPVFEWDVNSSWPMTLPGLPA